MKRIATWFLLMALLLPTTAIGEQNKSAAPRVVAPGFTYHTIGTEAGQLVRLNYDVAEVAGGLFVLKDGYLSIPYVLEDDVVAPYPSGKPLTFLNSDLSVRWTLKDERLTGAWYTELLELPDALVLGSERSLPEIGQIHSLLLIEKATGAIRWQVEGQKQVGDGLVWVSKCRADADGNILVGSNGALGGAKDGVGTLSLLNSTDGSLLWSVEYLEAYGMTSILDLCPLGTGWLLSGMRGQDRIILYADAKGAAQGYFTLQSRDEGQDYTSLWLMPISANLVYLGGWEHEATVGEVQEPYLNRTMYLMPITAETFQHKLVP